MLKRSLKRYISILMLAVMLMPIVCTPTYAITMNNKDIEKILEELEDKEIQKIREKLNNILLLLDIKDDGTFYFDETEAVTLGLSEEQIQEVKQSFESMNRNEGEALVSLTSEIIPNDALVLPIITIGKLLEILLAAGLRWLVAEILEQGVAAACRRWADVHEVFWDYCVRKGHI